MLTPQDTHTPAKPRQDLEPHAFGRFAARRPGPSIPRFAGADVRVKETVDFLDFFDDDLVGAGAFLFERVHRVGERQHRERGDENQGHDADGDHDLDEGEPSAVRSASPTDRSPCEALRLHHLSSFFHLRPRLGSGSLRAGSALCADETCLRPDPKGFILDLTALVILFGSTKGDHVRVLPAPLGNPLPTGSPNFASASRWRLDLVRRSVLDEAARP